MTAADIDARLQKAIRALAAGMGIDESAAATKLARTSTIATADAEHCDRGLAARDALTAALRYAEKFGWPVFPRGLGGKAWVPYTEHGWKNASRDPSQISEWWTRWPNALAATPTGAASGIVVLDIDRKNGKDGFETLSARGLSDLPETPMAHSPHGGVHLYFAVNPKVAIGFKPNWEPGLDILGNGSSIALPTPGWGYSWDPHYHPGNTPFLIAPAWLATKKKPNGRDGNLDPGRLLAEACSRIRGARPGERHDVINREAFLVGCLVGGRALSEGDAKHELEAAVVAMTWSTAGDAKKAGRDLIDAFTSGIRKGHRR